MCGIRPTTRQQCDQVNLCNCWTENARSLLQITKSCAKTVYEQGPTPMRGCWHRHISVTCLQIFDWQERHSPWVSATQASATRAIRAIAAVFVVVG
jgi:hypothetical protein